MRTLGARFARVIKVQLYLPTEGVRLVRIPGALIVLALSATGRQTLRGVKPEAKVICSQGRFGFWPPAWRLPGRGILPAPKSLYNVVGNGRRNEKAGRLTPASRLWP